MKIDIDMSELSDLAEELIKVAPERAHSAAHSVTKAESAATQTRAKTAAPRDRPWLATQGIRRKSGKDAQGAWSIVYTIPDPRGRSVAFYVEYGTSRMPPQPFMTPAIEPAHTSYPAALSEAVDPFGGDSKGAGGGLADEG
jgi:HK97 gp10 family phage protein